MGLRSKCDHESRHVRPKSVWWMLLSHHAPCDFGRTWSIGGVRVCVRCLAVFVFVVAALCTARSLPDPSALSIVLTALSVFPAWVDFALGEIWKGYPQTNFFRFLTGAIFGSGLGVSLGWCVFASRWLPVCLFVAVTVLVELAVAFIFYFIGCLDAYLHKYEHALGIHERCGRSCGDRDEA